MAIKKSQLYSTLWEACNALRGGIDPSLYKNYVLMILFVKYISDKAKNTSQPTKIKVPEGCSFDDFVKLKGKVDIADEIDKKLAKIIEDNAGYIKGITPPKFDDDTLGKDLDKKWTKLIGVFQKKELDFSKNLAADDDLLGDAYEYLIKNFAVLGGKSKGQFYTPAEVSRLIASILNLRELNTARNTIYDPTCGSGSLLLRALDETNGKPKLYGQEYDPMTVTLAKLNMILHGVVTADIQTGDTLNSPQFTVGDSLRTFDICVANPPFSHKNWISEELNNIGKEDDRYGRWSEDLLPPIKCGDFAFLKHLITSMDPDHGRGACILPHGVLFRGNAEYDIRKSIIEKGVIKGIIGLPSNVFFGTGIPASIIVLDNKDAKSRKGIFFIDAQFGYKKDAAKNRLREQDIKLILDTWNGFRDVPHYARFVSLEEIRQNDYNLNIPRYITPVDREVIHDIQRHISGGLPKHDIDVTLAGVWEKFPNLKDILFEDCGDYYCMKIGESGIFDTISNSADIQQEKLNCTSTLRGWLNDFDDTVRQYSANSFDPKIEIARIGNSILEAFGNSVLLNNYSVYELLRNYWADVMQDDFYIISTEGWKVARIPIYNAKEEPIGHTYDPLTDSLMERVYFPDLRKKLDEATALEDQARQELEQYVEDNESGYFDDSRYFRFQIRKTKKKKVVIEPGCCCEKCIQMRNSELLDIYIAKCKEIKKQDKKAEPTYKSVFDAQQYEEFMVLRRYFDLLDEKKNATKAKNKIAKELEESIRKMYESFYCNRDEQSTMDEIRNLVIEDKWAYDIRNIFSQFLNSEVQNIVSEIQAIQNRYANTLQDLNSKSSDLERKVMSHLNKMGFNYGK